MEGVKGGVWQGRVRWEEEGSVEGGVGERKWALERYPVSEN